MGQNSSLYQAFGNFSEYHHGCLIFENREEQLEAVAAFLRLGLERREKCIWLVPDGEQPTAASALREAGLEVGPALQSGALELLPMGKPAGNARHPVLGEGGVSLEAAVAAGFAGLRTTLDLTHLTGNGAGVAWLLPHESRLNALLERMACFSLCQYDRRRFPAEVLLGVVRTHPVIVHRGSLWQNFYYVPPREFLHPDRPAREVDRLLGNIRLRGRVEAALRRAHDVLEVRVRERTQQLEQANQALLAEMVERTRALAALQASEQRYRHLFNEAADIIFTLDLQGRFTSLNRATERLTGYCAEELTGQSATRIVTTETAERARQLLQAKLGGQDRATYEITCLAKDGRPVQLEISTRPLLDHGQPVGVIGVGRDITERKRSEELLRESQAALQRSSQQLRALAAGLFTAQEEERRRLSRELHDDLNQKLAMLTIEAECLERELPPGLGAARRRIERLRDGATALSDDVRRIAYELHPSILDHLGLVVALGSYCTEFSRRYGIPVRFIRRRLPPVIPPKVALCLYRVAQEALANVAKHSQSARATVVLSGSPGRLHLSITDSGVGFDLRAVQDRHGLGLITMEERVRLADGDFWVRARPGEGTRLDARVPLSAEAS